MKRPLLLVAVACLALGALAWGLVRQVRGPAFAGYEVVARPLVQTVVATGRVVAVSRAQVGSPVTGVVVERRVREGDAVQPGDVLAVLRADDLEAAVREAEAALAQLQQSTRPQAQAVSHEAEARLVQASREATRRRDLFQRRQRNDAANKMRVGLANGLRAAVSKPALDFLTLGLSSRCPRPGARAAS